MTHRDRIVIGAPPVASRLSSVCWARFPPTSGPQFWWWSTPAGRGDSLLAYIFGRASHLPVAHPADGDRIELGHIYVAPPDFHMLVDGDHLRVLQGPRENLHRPAIDPLFRSAALAGGRRVIGVVLTGMLDDGTSGLMVVRAHGGAAIVEDPRTAMFSAMSANALEQVPDAKVFLSSKFLPNSSASSRKSSRIGPRQRPTTTRRKPKPNFWSRRCHS